MGEGGGGARARRKKVGGNGLFWLGNRFTIGEWKDVRLDLEERVLVARCIHHFGGFWIGL